MTKGSLRTVIAALGWFALVAAASTVQTQETNTVGNPQLKDFELPGTRTVPPTTQQPAPATTPPATALPPATLPPVSIPPAATATPAQRPSPPPSATNVPAAPRPRASTPPRAGAAPAPAPAAQAPAGELPAAVPAPAELEQALPAPPAAAPRTQGQPPVPAAEPERSLPWLYIAIALLALVSLLGLFAFKRSRASAANRAQQEEVAVEPEAAPAAPGEPDPLFARRPQRASLPAAAAPSPAAPAAPAAAPEEGIVGISMRPRLELEFKADRAAATLTDASVQFALTIRNVGNRTARDIRIQIQMLNAGPEQDQEIQAFFAQPLPEEVAPAIGAIPPGSEAEIKTGVTLPREQVRELIIEGRRLFIPVVSFNVYYLWDGGRSGQTSMSYVVGREAPTPQEKMGAFRLDLGPRLYRQVGQRQAHLAKVV